MHMVIYINKYRLGEDSNACSSHEEAKRMAEGS